MGEDELPYGSPGRPGSKAVIGMLARLGRG